MRQSSQRSWYFHLLSTIYTNARDAVRIGHELDNAISNYRWKVWGSQRRCKMPISQCNQRPFCNSDPRRLTLKLGLSISTSFCQLDTCKPTRQPFKGPMEERSVASFPAQVHMRHDSPSATMLVYWCRPRRKPKGHLGNLSAVHYFIC